MFGVYAHLNYMFPVNLMCWMVVSVAYIWLSLRQAQHTTNYLTSMRAKWIGIKIRGGGRCTHKPTWPHFNRNGKKKIKMKIKIFYYRFCNCSVEIVIYMGVRLLNTPLERRYSTMESCRTQLYLCTTRWQRTDNCACSRRQRETFRTLCIHRIR